MNRADPDRVGVAVGVRVYPGTKIESIALRKALTGAVLGGDNPTEPLFFIEPEVYPFVFELLDKLIGGDRRYFFQDPDRPEKNYNYNANQLLAEAIQKGYRGAYWDILRRYMEASGVKE